MYKKALLYFTPDELAEAFAATRGVASPTQLRNFLKQDGRDLLEQFRALAPARPRVTIQRWTIRRVGLILLTLIVMTAAGAFSLSLFFPSRGEVGAPAFDSNRTMILMARPCPRPHDCPASGRSPRAGVSPVPRSFATERRSSCS